MRRFSADFAAGYFPPQQSPGQHDPPWQQLAQQLPGQHFAPGVQQVVTVAASSDMENSDVASRARIFVFIGNSSQCENCVARARAQLRLPRKDSATHGRI